MISEEEALASVPAHDRGPYVHAVRFAALGHAVMPHKTGLNFATCDLSELRGMNELAPTANWFLRAQDRDSLIVLRFTDDDDIRACEERMGKLPRTITVERPGRIFLIYSRPMGCPKLAAYRRLTPDSTGCVVTQCPLPGNRKGDGRLYRSRDSCALGELSFAFLPRSYIFGAPRRGGMQSDVPVPLSGLEYAPRPEFDAHAHRGPRQHIYLWDTEHQQ